MTDERRFRVLRDQSRLGRSERDAWPAELPWSIVEPWREQAERNHSQTLEHLNQRGGLTPEELWLAAHGHGLFRVRIPEGEVGRWLMGLVQ